MKAYRLSVNLKLGLIVLAVSIAVASLGYTSRLVDRLRDREQSVIRLWAQALEQLPKAQQQSVNPYQREFSDLAIILADDATSAALPDSLDVARLRRAISWAQSMPPSGELSFIMDGILVPNAFDIPAIVTDVERGVPVSWRNVPVDSTLNGLSSSDSARAIRRLARIQAEMDQTHQPVAIELSFPDSPARLRQEVHYGESRLIRELRIYPWIQLLFVGLFVLVGYMGFSYVRRSEQSSLWVGMAKEAAHQLGTPISSLMGWVEVMRMTDSEKSRQVEAIDEMENDLDRLSRVANRFSDIGSMPKLQSTDIKAVVDTSADYMRRRMPQERVTLTTDIEAGLAAPLNQQLFEWVLENLLKNALDAIEGETGTISVTGRQDDSWIHIDVTDSGKGIDRKERQNIFRPGYSTKKRGWGLGLSLAKRIVEDYHGGSLVLHQSRVGHGSTFRITIPQSWSKRSRRNTAEQ